VSKDGFRPSRQTGIALQVDQVARLEMALSVGTLAEAVEVSAAAPLLNTDNGVCGEVIGAWEIAEIPLGGRDFSSLAYLVPGVNRQAEGGGPPFPIGGGRPDNTNYQIDGFNNQNARIGEAQVSPPLDSLQELKVLVNGYSAENGRLAGGAVSMALKSGGNRSHGTLFEYLRNDVFDARNFFADGKPKLRRRQYGGQLDGPVVLPKVYNGRDRTFFLANIEKYSNRGGDFSQTRDAARNLVRIKDPCGTAACTATQAAGCYLGNRIPASLLDPVARNVAPCWPLPNRPGDTIVQTGGARTMQLALKYVF